MKAAIFYGPNQPLKIDGMRRIRKRQRQRGNGFVNSPRGNGLG
jgi:hypothetical protein